MKSEKFTPAGMPQVRGDANGQLAIGGELKHRKIQKWGKMRTAFELGPPEQALAFPPLVWIAH